MMMLRSRRLVTVLLILCGVVGVQYMIWIWGGNVPDIVQFNFKFGSGVVDEPVVAEESKEEQQQEQQSEEQQPEQPQEGDEAKEKVDGGEDDSGGSQEAVGSEKVESETPEEEEKEKEGSKASSSSSTLHLSDGLYRNYFYSDKNVAAQVVISSHQLNARMIIAYPSGDSGICAYFHTRDEADGPLTIRLTDSSVGSPLAPVYKEVGDKGDDSTDDSDHPEVGVKGVIQFGKKAKLGVTILGSIRNIRDFTDGASILDPLIQNAVEIKQVGQDVVEISRRWFDNVTVSTLSFTPLDEGSISVNDYGQVEFEAESYIFSASYNYPQQQPLSIDELVNDEFKSSVESQHDDALSLSFLSSHEKLLAGAWRFLTYFGRDSLISALLLEPILSKDRAGNAIEVVLGSVMERINKDDGRVCHEESIGDYAAYLNIKKGNEDKAEFRCDYGMVDTEFLLPILFLRYLESSPNGRERLPEFLATKAGKVNPNNEGLTWGDLVTITARKIMNDTAAFAAPGGQTKENLIHLQKHHAVGQWRDSLHGLGHGHIPFDVNSALVPAALRAIAELSRQFQGTMFGDDAAEWAELADTQAQVWEDTVLLFFETILSAADARNRLNHFAATSPYYNGPSQAETIDTETVMFYSLALDSANGLPIIPVVNTDSCFRLFFHEAQGDSSADSQAQWTRFLNVTAHSINRPFPAGLTTSVGLVVANPAFSQDSGVLNNFTNAAYHGSVVWSWQLAMMAAGLEKQLSSCDIASSSSSSLSPRRSSLASKKPAWCNDDVVHANLRTAYNTLWNTIERNEDYLSTEVWSWRYNSRASENEEAFVYAPLSSLPTPPDEDGPVESNIRQLWSLAFLAVKRNDRWI